ncbi:hypothetical protein [Acuticoccus mangrovi]|uniref:Uncharacterized protein n=1 Tax=Acuticoccus mangrovi TaxID=2796142 RepID=A0A934IJK3_9HYPH|nr:hypothetical protein [Acuticoccus mangrovi]MBJ3777874.1 hypothetical protein [Acuticoccus mangrovi]
MSLLVGPLATEIAAALEAEGVPYAVTVTRMEGGEPANPWDPPTDPVPTEYPCRGWRDEWDQDVVDGTLIQQNDVKIVVLATTLSIVPTSSETVTVDGLTYNIINITTDPANATFTLQARR